MPTDGLPPQRTTPSGLLAAVVARIVDQTGISASRCRICLGPNPTFDEYHAERNVGVRLQTPEPFEYSGAGRRAYKIARVIEVFVATVCLADVAGDNTIAGTLHYDFEDEVIDALLLTPPDGSTGWGPLTYAGGGQVPTSLVKDDPGYNVSCLLFRTHYCPSVTVRVP